jgi:exodeoxyribonuclease VII large subunit
VTTRRSARSSDGADLDLFAGEAPESKVRAASTVREPRRASASRGFIDPLDAYPGTTAASAISIGMLTETARDVIEGAFVPLWVRGEVSDFKAHRNGHWYFCLRDRTAQIRCVVWKRDKHAMFAPPDDGMQVAAFGRLTVYAARGEMQFSVLRMEAEGDGLRRKALEITRDRLAADGLLDPHRKRQLPRFPRVIGVVTSPDGAALHDIVAVLRRRAAGVRLVVVPTAVQGDAAPEELCFALDQVNRWAGADLVIVSRGGGAREDLWAFNNERVARAVAGCRVPTISAVGHEIDVSMCDLVADYRAATPSAAAEAATPSRAELTSELRQMGDRIASGMSSNLQSADVTLRRAARALHAASRVCVESKRAGLSAIAGRLHALSPLATLARGYAVARGADGSSLTSVSQFADAMSFDLVVRDGVVPSAVRGKPTRRDSIG